MKVYTAAACLLHDQGGGHPEAPARLATVLQSLSDERDVTIIESPSATLDSLKICHDPSYLERARSMSLQGGGELGLDTIVNRHSWDAVTAASGAAQHALRDALDSGSSGFAAIRPPGHHALADRAMGFCIVNHIAVLAELAHRAGRDRVLIIDWDVHHGNGTQALIEHDPRTRFVSMHQWPWYPGTGSAGEHGLGNVFNLPMSPGLPASTYVETLWSGVVRATQDWVPQLILISAGYDAMLGDPLGGFTLEPDDYAEWIRRLRTSWPDVPIVALMEGGYAPDRLADGVLATVQAMG